MSSDSDAPLGDIRRKIQSSSNVPMPRPTKKIMLSSSSSDDEVVEKVRKVAEKTSMKKTKGGENQPPSKSVSVKKHPLPKKMKMLSPTVTSSDSYGEDILKPYRKVDSKTQKESEGVKEEVKSDSTDDSEPRRRKTKKADACSSSTTGSNGGEAADAEILECDQIPEKTPDARTADSSDTSINDSDQEEIIRTKKTSTASAKPAVTARDDGDTSDTSLLDSDEDEQKNTKNMKTAFTKTSAKEAGDTSDTSIEDDKEAFAEKKLSEEKRRSKKKAKNLTKQRLEDVDGSEESANKKMEKRKEKSEGEHKGGTGMAKKEKKQSTGRTASEAAAIRLVRIKKMAHMAGLRFNYKKLFDDCSTDKERVKLLESRLINNGLETPFTIESCKKFKLLREQEAELAELSTNTIIDIGAGEKTRVTRSRYSAVAPPTSSVRRGRAMLDTSDEEDDSETDERPQTGKEMFSNLRGIISSGGESSD